MNRIRVIDWLSRKHSWRYYRQYVASQWYDRERLDSLRVTKLRALLTHCERRVPFYRDMMRRVGMRADDVRGLDALTHLPVIDKAMIKRDYEQFVSEPG